MGNCCSCNDDGNVKISDAQNRSSKTKKDRNKKAGTGLHLNEDQFNQFKDDIEKDSDMVLWSDVEGLEEDDVNDSDDTSNEITLKRRGDTKQLFKKSFMDKVSKHMTEEVKAKYKDLGPFRYRKSEYNNLDYDESDLEVRTVTAKEDGSIYFGQWKKQSEFKEGRGILIKKDGTMYEGFFKDAAFHGVGRTIFGNGDVYQGEYKSGFSDGFGIFISDELKYKGEWKNGQQDGEGYQSFADGSSYKGEFTNGLREGKGLFKWEDGSWYEGQMKSNNLHGKGEYNWADGRKYIGQFKNNKMNGKGVFTWEDGREYEGEYVDDKKHGYGEYRWPDGRIYKGQWADSKQHGEALYVNKDGVEKKGVWEHGKHVKWLK